MQLNKLIWIIEEITSVKGEVLLAFSQNRVSPAFINTNRPNRYKLEIPTVHHSCIRPGM
jgi:hypothetical protein